MSTEDGIRLVSLEGGDYGLPAPGYVFNTATPEESTAKVRRWAMDLLRLRRACADPYRPVCPIYIVGPRQTDILEEVAAVLPAGVEILRGGGRYVFPSRDSGEGVITAKVFYLLAP